MSEYVVKLPDVGEGIAEAEIVEWHVNVGDTITEDQVMVEVMTDKATVELPSPVAGVVISVGAAVGEVLQVGSPLIRIETGGGIRAAGARAAPTPRSSRCRRQTNGDLRRPSHRIPQARHRQCHRPSARVAATAAPAVRQRAKAMGIDLADVAGTGPDGRVVHADLDTRARATAPAATRPPTSARTSGRRHRRRRSRHRIATQHRSTNAGRQDPDPPLHLRRGGRCH